MRGEGAHLEWPYEEGSRALATPHVPAALSFAIVRDWRRSIAYLVLNYNKHNKCEKASWTHQYITAVCVGMCL